MRKTKLYLDTSVPSFLFTEDSPEKRKTTIKFWELLRLEIYEIVISDILLIEINRAKPPLNNQLAECIAQLSPFVIHVTEDIHNLGEKYVQEKIIPQKYFDDALHLACATYANVDSVVSWNFKHFVNLKTIRGVNGVNRIVGLKEIEILTPQSWIEEE